MRYFIDFDRTLFDSDAYNAYIVEHTACAPLREELRAALGSSHDRYALPPAHRLAAWDKITELFNSGELSFTPGELGHLLFPDAREFLGRAGADIMVITYGEEVRQRAKVESALAGVFDGTVLYTGELGKGAYLEKHPELVPEEAAFVDDLPPHLEEVHAAFPHVRLFEMRRDELSGSGNFPVIRSLSELP